jgi:cytochrome c-type biogenesis protein CcmE
MKKTHIIAIVAIAVAIAFVLSSLFEASTYADFEKAFSARGSEFHVVGVLDADCDIAYDPAINASLTTFCMKDDKGISRPVRLLKSKPQDFERSETIVLIGKAAESGNEFIAREILLKCPSKYEEEAKVSQ